VVYRDYVLSILPHRLPDPYLGVHTMAYADKRDGKHTGSFVGEWAKGGKKRRFKTLRDAKDYEMFCKLMGREPPTIEEGIGSTDGPKFSEVAAQCKSAGGPRGKWHAERDCSIIQRVDHAVDIIGAYPISYVHDHAQEMADKIVASLTKPKAPGKKQPLSNATKNRYVNAYGAVLKYAYKKRLITTRPPLELLDEVTDRKERDPLNFGQDEVVLRLMRDAGNDIEATCVEALIETGLRSGELRKLAPEQVTIEQVMDEDGTDVPVGVITLRKGRTKNNKARLVAFSADLARQIRAIAAAGNMPTKDKLLYDFKSACNRAGYTGNLVIHSLRHTRVTRMRKAGISEEIRMKLVGHSGKDVHAGYDHVDLEDQLEVVKKVREHAGKRGSKSSVVPFDNKKSA
jgi:integrase